MTSATARTAANVALVTLGAAAAYVIVTTPPLRRLAVRGVRWWLGASIPIYVMTEVKDAWLQSRRAA
jgi:hypothetical protein